MGAKGVMSMTAREVRQLYVVQQVLERRIRQRKAAELLQRSVRQIKRLVHRVRIEGPAGMGHRLRGRPSNRRHPEAVKRRVLRLWQTRYRGFGPTLTQEKLVERDQIHVGRETVRRWLVAGGLWTQTRKGRPHRRWRERKACWGERVQVDGSHHAWLEGRGPALVLMGYIDDATNHVFARFYDYEGTLPAMDSFTRYVQRYGLPQSVYVDRHTTYQGRGKPTLADELAGRERPQSQFERALAELEVQVIPAYSPQAKGRIERLFGTFQDRLIKELRLAGVKTREEANGFLEGYLPRDNRRFRRSPREAVNLHRPSPGARRLRRILAVRHTHPLRNDNTVRHGKQWYLVQGRWNGRRPNTLQAEERLDGKLYLMDGDRPLRYREVLERPRASQPPHRSPSGWQRRLPPPPDHPWRRFPAIQHRRKGTFLLSGKGDISNGR